MHMFRKTDKEKFSAILCVFIMTLTRSLFVNKNIKLVFQLANCYVVM